MRAKTVEHRTYAMPPMAIYRRWHPSAAPVSALEPVTRPLPNTRYPDVAAAKSHEMEQPEQVRRMSGVRRRAAFQLYTRMECGWGGCSISLGGGWRFKEAP